MLSPTANYIVEVFWSLGGIAGFTSLLYILWHYYSLPKLKFIEFDHEKDVSFYSNRKFGTIRVENVGHRTAKNCIVRIKFLKNKPNEIEEVYYGHWADVEYSPRTSGAEPINLIYGERRRLDIIFTDESQELLAGSWIPVGIALTGSLKKNSISKENIRFYLPPGEYEVEVVAICENGEFDKSGFKIVSPNRWEDLDLINNWHPFLSNLQYQLELNWAERIIKKQ